MPRLQKLNNAVRVARKKKPKPKVVVTVPPPAPDNSNLAKDIQRAIAQIPKPNITVSPPKVTVKAPDVNVNFPPAKEIGQEMAREMDRLRPLPSGYHATIERSRGKMTGATITRIK